MSSYEYSPDSWSPILAGLVAGAVGAVAASLISIPLDSPNQTVANTASITVVALLIGGFSGFLWRRVRASQHGLRTYRVSVALALVAALTALAITDLFGVDNVFSYAVAPALVIFVSIGLLTPTLDELAIPQWIGWAIVVVALVVAVSGLLA